MWKGAVPARDLVFASWFRDGHIDKNEIETMYYIFISTMPMFAINLTLSKPPALNLHFILFLQNLAKYLQRERHKPIAYPWCRSGGMGRPFCASNRFSNQNWFYCERLSEKKTSWHPVVAAADSDKFPCLQTILTFRLKQTC